MSNKGKTKENRLNVIDKLEIHMVMYDEIGCNVHTHGMSEFGYPELFIDTPILFANEAGSVLNNVADWIVNNLNLEEGESLESHRLLLDGYCPAPISFVPETNFGDNSLRLIVVVNCSCDECRCAECGGMLLE